eukprot:CAMPEP_0114547766 /NCGR_PEP_ID=MMETSP0114-20121206/4631_1 /TAXON_ID=31324 /ORGANISM="Goniomonas sp, Strain m" /LENGTH=105 /DNA_ID=CAMNT_0001732327 /DNA_START=98 /DNA_END=411 /DNA_ORIENTATION=-
MSADCERAEQADKTGVHLPKFGGSGAFFTRSMPRVLTSNEPSAEVLALRSKQMPDSPVGASSSTFRNLRRENKPPEEHIGATGDSATRFPVLDRSSGFSSILDAR